MIFIKTRGWFWRQQYIYIHVVNAWYYGIYINVGEWFQHRATIGFNQTRRESCTVISTLAIRESSTVVCFIYNQQVTPFAPALLS